MMGQLDRTDAWASDEDDGVQVARLGPPGWDEFAGARARFMRTLEVTGLETAWTSPALEPARRDREEGRP